jgi:hypothetical protein
MTHIPPAQAEAHLRSVTRKFAQWRQHRPTPRGYRIPDPLWAEAVRLAQVLSLTYVAKQLGLKPAALKRRRGVVETTGEAPASTTTPQFVEVTTDTWRTVSVEVEVLRPDGVRLRVRYRDPAPVLTLLHSFLEGR